MILLDNKDEAIFRKMSRIEDVLSIISDGLQVSYFLFNKEYLKAIEILYKAWYSFFYGRNHKAVEWEDDIFPSLSFRYL